MLKGLKNLIFEEEQPQTKPDSKSAPLPATSLAASDAAPHEVTADSSDGHITLNLQDVEAGLENAVRGTPEFAPIMSFLAAVDSLKNVPGMDEATCFRAALATTKIPVADLHAAINVPATVLNGETERFANKFVASVQNTIAATTQEQTELGNEIEKAQQHLNELTTKRSEAIKTADMMTADLEKAKIEFQQLVKNVAGRYLELDGKLTKYLGA